MNVYCWRVYYCIGDCQCVWHMIFLFYPLQNHTQFWRILNPDISLFWTMLSWKIIPKRFTLRIYNKKNTVVQLQNKKNIIQFTLRTCLNFIFWSFVIFGIWYEYFWAFRPDTNNKNDFYALYVCVYAIRGYFSPNSMIPRIVHIFQEQVNLVLWKN